MQIIILSELKCIIAKKIRIENEPAIMKLLGMYSKTKEF
jgi:hypothetical protein